MKLNRSKKFFIIAIAFWLGIFCGSFFDFSLLFEYFLIILSIGLIGFFYCQKKFWFIGLSVLFFSFGILKVETFLLKMNELNLNGENISQKVIVEKVEDREKYKMVIVDVEGDKNNEYGDILLRLDLYDEVEYGDELNLKCELKLPENFTDDFDYRMYLYKSGVYYICNHPTFEKTEKNQGSYLFKLVFKLRELSEQKVSGLIPEPEAGLANGLLFGGDGRLSQDVKNDFSRTGMTHIVAVSGYNVTIIAEYLMMLGIFLGLWRKQAFYFAIFGIFIFVVMIGMPSSAIRAGVMGTLLLWAMKNGRIANSYNAIILAGGIMIFFNPLLFRWDIGFQLSFLATLGIVVMGQFWEKYFQKRNDALGLLEVMFMTISAQIFVLPIIMYNFHTFSVVSVLVNVLVLQVVPISMLLVFLVVVFGFIFYPLAIVFSWLAYLTLWYEVEIIRYFSGLKWASLDVNNFGWWGIAIWYFVLIGAVYAAKNIEKD